MYDINGKYLYEILDDYKDTFDDSKKDEILKSFMKLVWSSKNKRIISNRVIKFNVLDSLIDTEIGQVFNEYSCIKYTVYKSMTKQRDFVSLIRQKINNIYTNMCDGRVCTRKEYMDLIKLPKKLYYRWKNGEEYDIATLTSQIDDALKDAELIKEKYANQKMDISWGNYKKLVAGYFKSMFNNYIPLEDYEDKTLLSVHTGAWHEDNFAIAYFSKGLDGYMKMYQKKYYGLPEHRLYGRCECGGMFVQSKQNNRFKCDKCNSYRPMENKTINCIDCGKEVVVDTLDNQTTRCDECYEVYRKKYKAIKEKERRERLKNQ